MKRPAEPTSRLSGQAPENRFLNSKREEGVSRIASKVVTIRDVARHAGVSVATVSNVLNGQKKVRNLSYERVTEAARELNYRPDPAAAWLRSGRSRVVASLSPNLENTFFSGMIAAVERLCHADGYELFLASSDGLPEVEAARTRSLLQWRPAAFFIIPCGERLPELEAAEEAGVPIVIADRVLTDRDCDFVELDNRQSGALAARHLLDLGHRHIVVVAPSFSVINIRERFEGVASALAAAGGPPPVPFETRHLREEAEPLTLQPGQLGDATAAIALTNFTTLQLLGGLGRIGLRVPRDISLVGFDDTAWMNVASPSVTAIRQPVSRMGEAVWNRLHARIHGTEEPPCHEKHPGELVIRESTGRLVKDA